MTELGITPAQTAGPYLRIGLNNVAFAAALLGRSTDLAPMGSTLTAEDRLALDAPAVVRGAPAAPVDPAVDLGDPEAVARAYLTAALSLTADDTGRTHLRAAGYAEPGSPPATVGVLVLDPPAPGEVAEADAPKEKPHCRDIQP